MLRLVSCAFTILLVFSTSIFSQQVKPLPPLPSARQLKSAGMEFYLFVHFGPNTFTDLEWGKGTEHEEVFNPTALDCNQWVRIAKAAGAKGIVITAKHHDGFCLWPSKFSTHTVAQSKWKNGKGDVLKELASACKKGGIKFGVYLSPWDRNHPKYGTAEYNDVYVNMMHEVVQKYGPLFEFWWDGANGEGPNGKKQVYDFHRFERTIRSIAPNTVVFSDLGPDLRWVGNENGIAGDPDWALLDTAGFSRGAGAPKEDTLNHGNENGTTWIQAECDVSIRPGWFYHQQEDAKVKTPEQLFDLYLKSVGRGANLILNVPPDRRGLFAAEDSASLVGFRKLLEKKFSHSLLTRETKMQFQKGGNASLLKDKNAETYLSAGKNYPQNPLLISFKNPVELNCIQLQEPIQMGQRIKKFKVEILLNGNPVYAEEKTTIGHKRILTFPAQRGDAIRITIEEAKAEPLLGEVDVF